MAQFLAAGIVALVVLIVVSGWFGQRAAVTQAVEDAERTTQVLATSAVQPALTRGLVDGRAAALDRFDRLVRSRILIGDVLRVKLWDASGRIVYSDETRLIGRRFELGNTELGVLNSGGRDAEPSDLTKPENEFERSFGRLLEVYTQVKLRGGGPLLFEAYYSYDDVTRRSTEVLAAFRPITVGGLLLFLLLTVPVVWVLARRLETSGAERERLLVAAADASDTERRRIARDLHDGVVQELAGASFALSASVQELPERPDLAARLDDLGSAVRRSIRSLRSLLVEIYPPDLHTGGLPAALSDLVAPAADSGVRVSFEVEDSLHLSHDTSALVWRVAQEAVRNALRHARPERLWLRLWSTNHALHFEVVDDGQGFDPQEATPEGHLGLRVLSDLAREHGGSLTVDSARGHGTTLRLQVPLP
ncbi:MAG: sensor histidine kinase [Nocardioidaceae bacterium]